MSDRADPAAARLADRHYNRQKIGTPQFAPTGSCIVLLSEPFRDLQDAVAQFKAAHPDVTFGRMTTVGTEWLCIDGWLTPPDDQGPEPTDADVPVGFV